jgi:hypothetical protein
MVLTRIAKIPVFKKMAGRPVVQSQPVVIGACAYLGNGGLYAELAVAGSKVAWTAPSNGYRPVAATPSGHLIVENDDEVGVFDVKKRALSWHRPVEGYGIVDSYLLANEGACLRLLDLSDGHEVRQMAISDSGGGVVVPCSESVVLTRGDEDQRVSIAVSPVTWQQQWRQPWQRMLRDHGQGPPMYVGCAGDRSSIIVAGSGYVAGFRRVDGALMWVASIDVPCYQPLCIANALAVLAYERFVVIDDRSGGITVDVTHRRLAMAVRMTPAVLVGDHAALFVGELGDVAALSVRTGELIYYERFDASFGRPSLVSGILVVPVSNGTVWLFEVQL